MNLFHPFSSHRPRVEITQYHCTRVRNMAEITIQCLAQKVNTRPETWWNDVLSSTRKRARCFPLSLFNAFIRPTKCPILIISERVARRVSLFRTEREREREREKKTITRHNAVPIWLCNFFPGAGRYAGRLMLHSGNKSTDGGMFLSLFFF